MTPAGRVGLACAVVAAAALLIVSAASGRWFHSHSDNPYDEQATRWEGFGGPYDEDEIGTGLSGSDVIAATAGFSALFGFGLGLFVAFGTIVGRRRDHVPRLAALFGWSFAAGAVLLQALAITTWPISKQPEPRGFGWAMPVYFLAAVALLVTLLMLWRDASKRARASADALAKVNRELAARDLAAMPELAPEEPPVERV